MSEQGDRAMANLTAKLLGQPQPYPARPAPAPLRAVTAENAHEFKPAPRKRGRPRRIDARDNVVPIGSRRSAAALPVTPASGLSIDDAARTMAIASSCRDLGESERSGKPMRMSYAEHLAAAYRELGYIRPTT